jgi:hypothetical protein
MRAPVTVCLSADIGGYLQGGGHVWAYLNWAIGLLEAGADVIWLEGIHPHAAPQRLEELRCTLAPFGLGDSVALYSKTMGSLPKAVSEFALDVADAAEASTLLLNLRYDLPAEIVAAFRRTALVDIDPGLLQLWLRGRKLQLARYDAYFTTGEGVSTGCFDDLGIRWNYGPPPVSLQAWPAVQAGNGAYTTVSHWSGEEAIVLHDRPIVNTKRSSFFKFLDLPLRVTAPLELALCLAGDEEEDRRLLGSKGWRVRHSLEVSSSPEAYRSYIQSSRGEFSCVKPSCVLLQNGWIGDRTPCYLASGKPVIVQDTGPVSFLSGEEGFLRFRTVTEAAAAIETVEADYDRHARAARQLAETYFDARKVAKHVLELAIA